MGKQAKRQRRIERRPTLGQVLTPEIAREMAATERGREALHGMLRQLAADEKRLREATDEMIAGIHKRAADTAQLYAGLEAKAIANRDAAIAKDKGTIALIEEVLAERAP